MSEEVQKAKKAVPRSMILTIVLNGLLAYGIILAMLFSLGDPDVVLRSPYPIIPIVMNAAGKAGGTAMIVGLLVIIFCVVAASMASVSRITWAWARDGALPPWFAKVDRRYRVPVRAVWLPVIIVSLISLFSIGNTATATVFSAFTALSSLGLYSSYIVAILCLLHARLTGRLGEGPEYPVQYGEWRLPRNLATPLNSLALAWTIYLTIWLPFPTTLPVTGTNMNYAGPIYVVVVCMVIGYWFAWGKMRWSGLNQSPIIDVVRND